MSSGYQKCLDGSSEIKEAEDGHCEKEDDVMCTARDWEFEGKKICVAKNFQCDNYLQCRDGKDEEMCEEEYRKKRIFTRDQRVICRSPFLNITSEENKTGKFFPMRAIRCNPVVLIVSTFIIMITIYIIMITR